MPPRKKGNSSAKKSNAVKESQPSKFGIQHFFERHTQNAATQKRSSASIDLVSNQENENPISSEVNPKSDFNSAALPPQNPKNVGVSVSQNPKIDLVSQDKEKINPSENTPPEDLVPVDAVSELSPEICKSVSLKRLKFSPGMIIKQSQDDGGDEVTWRISPINERLQAVSKKMPEVIKVLAESSRHNSFTMLRSCSQNKTLQVAHPCPGIAVNVDSKVDKSLPLSSPKASKKSMVAPSRICLKRVNPYQGPENNASIVDSNGSLASQPSPFRTPPSLSYSHDKLTNGDSCGGQSDQPDSRQHKKALLELLDQVKDAISFEDLVSKDLESNSSKIESKNCDEMPIKVDPSVKGISTNLSDKVIDTSSDCHFLVLEVSEKRRTDRKSVV